MRYSEITNEDIGRRGFLRGLGAAAGLGTLGYQAYRQNTRQDSPPASTSDGVTQPNVATQPQRKPAPTAPVKPQRVIPKYSPQQLEKYIVDYARQHLPIDQCIQFLAQCKTETHDFRSLVEYDSSRHEQYEGGAQYKGRGYIHITHRSNYEKYGKLIGQDLVNDPDLLLYPNIAAQASIVYWKDYAWPTSQRLMRRFKDKFKTVVKAVTKSVNGGYNKLDERKKNVIYYTQMLKPGTGKIVPKKKSK